MIMFFFFRKTSKFLSYLGVVLQSIGFTEVYSVDVLVVSIEK